MSLNEYVESKRLSVRKKIINDHEYSLYCYTKDQFFNHEWDSITIEHRGKIYDQNGKSINNPFKKIFNLNEHESTHINEVVRAINNYDFEVLDKVNGHLTILSYDVSRDNVFVTTKGSFDGELAENDERVLRDLGVIDKIKHYKANLTLMFECLADYDKHLWFEEARKVYDVDHNTMILLGAIDNNTQSSLNHYALTALGATLNVPVVRRFRELEVKDVDIDSLFKHKLTEGYVFHFPEINFRFKVKTTEYVTLRYMKEVTPEKLVNVLYNSGRDNMYAQFDEELYPVLDAVMYDLEQFYFSKCVNKAKLELLKAHEWSAREISRSDNLNEFERSYLFRSSANIDAKSVRREFKASNHFPVTENAIKEFFDKALYNMNVQV